MEFFQENEMLYNIIGAIVAMLMFLLVLHLIKSRNKAFITILIVTGLVTAGYGITKFYPKVAEPVIKFIGGGWMNEN